MASSVGITAKEKVIFIFLDLHCHIKVTSLEGRIKGWLTFVTVKNYSFPILANSFNGLLDHIECGVVP